MSRGFCVLGLVASVACQQSASPTAPSTVASTSSQDVQLVGSSVVTQDVTFPPRDQPFDFRQQLEAKYRDELRRGAVTSFVDIEGDIVWIQEYLRYRVNLCDHLTAVQKVMDQIDGRGIQPICGAASSGAVSFPPRNEPFDFRTRLEQKYRDQLRRQAGTTFVDIEGDIVWVQEYLRYRVNSCGHAESIQKVFMQIDGAGVQPTCVTQPPATPRPTARFTFGGNQCGVVSVSGPANQLQCTFDGRASSGNINDYRWLFPGGVTRSGAVQQNVTVPCGSFGGGGGAASRNVSLTVSGPGGSDTSTLSVTFVLSTFC